MRQHNGTHNMTTTTQTGTPRTTHKVVSHHNITHNLHFPQHQHHRQRWQLNESTTNNPYSFRHRHDGSNNTQQVSTMKGHKTAQIMIDSGAATHVCPPWFADNYPIHKLAPEQGPQLRTVTNKEIQLHGVRWVYMQCQGQRIVIPFYVCDVHDTILSVTRLAEQGFDIRFNDVPTMTHNKGFNVQLVQRNNL